jgi:hypothetical protein
MKTMRREIDWVCFVISLKRALRELQWKSTAFGGCGKTRFLVIPTRSGGIPFVPKLSVSAFVRARDSMGATTDVWTTVEEHLFSRASRITEKRGL